MRFGADTQTAHQTGHTAACGAEGCGRRCILPALHAGDHVGLAGGGSTMQIRWPNTAEQLTLEGLP